MTKLYGESCMNRGNFTNGKFHNSSTINKFVQYLNCIQFQNPFYKQIGDTAIGNHFLVYQLVLKHFLKNFPHFREYGYATFMIYFQFFINA